MKINSIQVSVTRKAIKNIYLYIKPPDGHVEVSAPLTLSDEKIKIFISTKISWIRKQQAKFKLQPLQTESQFVSGETIYVWGKPYLLQINYSNKNNSCQIDKDKAILTVRKKSTAIQRENYVNKLYRSILKAEIERNLLKWEKITGLYCDSWQIKNMKTRWGTCNILTNKIWLNLQLAKKTPDCLEYVILHELAHFKEKNHDDKFVAIMDMYMLNWREIGKKLNGRIPNYGKNNYV